MTRVLFVCLGNICRSTMAEAIFSHKVREAGLADQIEVDSAGTGHWHVGEPPHPGTQGVLRRHHIAYEHRARRILPEDLNRFDYVITMDDENLADVRRIGSGSAVVRPMMSYDPESGCDEVPDPYYDGRFDRVYELLDGATARLLDTIRKERGL